MSNPYARIIVESLEELEQLAQELRDSNFTLSFRFDRLNEYSQRLQRIQSHWEAVKFLLERNDELKADIYANYLGEIARIGVLIDEITELITKRDWVRPKVQKSLLMIGIIERLIDIGQMSLSILEMVEQSQTALAAHIQSSVDYLKEHLQQNLLTG